MTGAVPEARISTWNLANQITILRLALVPVCIVLLAYDGGDSDGWRVAAFLVSFVTAMTDRLDGRIARNRGLVTSFGKLVDPIADKALTLGLLVTLSALDLLPWWVTVVMAVRELGVTALRFWVIRHGVIPASRGGKTKTFVQGLAIGLYELPWDGVLGTTRFWVMGVALAITLATGWDYVGRALKLRRESRA